LKDDILACVRNLRLVITECYNILKDFGFLSEDFLKIIFLHGEIFEFPSFFCLKIHFNVNGKATVVTHQLLLYWNSCFN
jgi:hypothetical protein